VLGVTSTRTKSPLAGIARDPETRQAAWRNRAHQPTPDPASGSHLVGMTPAEKRRYCDRARARSRREELRGGVVELLLRYPWEVSMTVTFQPNKRKGRVHHSSQFCERHLGRFLEQVDQHHWGREDGLFERSSLGFAIAWEKHVSGSLHAHLLGLGAPDRWWDYVWCRETAIEDPVIGRSFDIQGLPRTGAGRERAVRYVAKYITKDLQGLDFVNPERLRALSASPGAGAVAGSV